MKLTPTSFSDSFKNWVGLLLLAVVVSYLGLPVDALAQSPIPDPVVTMEVPGHKSVEPGTVLNVGVTVTTADNWHINTNPASMDSLIPTELSVAGESPVSIESVEYPEGGEFQFEFVDRPITVYQGSTEFPTRLRVDPSAKPGGYTVDLQLRYQACDDTRCLPPDTLKETWVLEVEQTSTEDGDQPSMTWETMAERPDQNTLVRTFDQRGWILGLVLIFFLGLSLNLTPCVYPMVPITVGYFGDSDRESLISRLLDALFFVMGMAIVYSLLGALAGMSGAILGETLQSPWLQAGLAGLMVILAGPMFGWYQFRLPEPIRRESRELGSALGTFGMGMTLGLVAAPCLAPATVALLSFVGQMQSVLAGAGLFFVLALGLGLPYVFLAVFSSYLTALPGSGAWMEWIKKLLGFVILGVAVYFLWPMLTNQQFAYLMVALTVVAAVVLVWFHPPEGTPLRLVRGGTVIATAGLLVYVLLRVFVWVPDAIPWQDGEDFVNQPYPEATRPTVVYLSADWCVPCKEMEVSTFRDNRVRRRLGGPIRPVKIDLTSEPSQPVSDWLGQYDVMGVPTMIMFDPDGQERQSLRLTGYVSAETLLRNLDELESSTPQ